MLSVDSFVDQYLSRLSFDLSVTVGGIDVDLIDGRVYVTASLSDGHQITGSDSWPYEWAPSIRDAIISATINALHGAREAALSGITSMANEDRPQ